MLSGNEPENRCQALSKMSFARNATSKQKKETYFSVVEDAEEAAAQSAEKLTFSDAKGSKRARMRDL